ncbi:MAG: SDR family oxidoreductase [Bacilli bacterium]|nr:SDR family oxidoreductase [Bacilli bacterium]
MERKVAVITGARRGLGASMATALARRGYNIVVNDFVEERELLNVVKNINDNYDVEALGVMADVKEESEVKRFLEVVKKKFGRVDVVINNAALVEDIELEFKKTEDFNRILTNNVTSTYLMSKIFGRFMYTNKKGKIINITSTNGINAYFPTSIDYDASKAAIISLTHNFALEYAPYVLVNAVAPGWINTEMNQDLPIKVIKEETEKIFLNRFAEPAEVASLVCYLASDDCSYINGEIIKIDGGYR